MEHGLDRHALDDRTCAFILAGGSDDAICSVTFGRTAVDGIPFLGEDHPASLPVVLAQ
jgi:hypothetical protein